MKKYIFNNTIVWLFGSVLIALASCSQDNQGTMYIPENNEAVFTVKSAEYLFAPTDPQEFAITVKRSSSIGAAEVSVTNDIASGEFAIPATVSFADGSLESTLKITFDQEKLETGKRNVIHLSLPESNISTYQTEMAVTITRDYSWELYAHGSYYRGLFETAKNTDIYRCVEAPENYRIMGPMAEGYNLQFVVAEDGSVSFPELNSYGGYEFTTGYNHPSYGMVYQEYYPEYAEFDADSKKITFYVYSYVGAGGFGYFNDVYTWE